jgi:hypothetical protein
VVTRFSITLATQQVIYANVGNNSKIMHFMKILDNLYLNFYWSLNGSRWATSTNYTFSKVIGMTIFGITMILIKSFCFLVKIKISFYYMFIISLVLSAFILLLVIRRYYNKQTTDQLIVKYPKSKYLHYFVLAIATIVGLSIMVAGFIYSSYIPSN